MKTKQSYGWNRSRSKNFNSERVETLKKQVEIIGGTLSIIAKMAGGVGVLATFFYLLLINFYPSHLTSGETVFFVFIALAFSLTYIVFITYSAASVIWIGHALTCLVWSLRFNKKSLASELFQLRPVKENAKQHRFTTLRNKLRKIRFASTRAALDNRNVVPEFASGFIIGISSAISFTVFAISAYLADSPNATEIFVASLVCGFVALAFGSIPVGAENIFRDTFLKAMGVSILPLMFFLYICWT